MTPEQIRALRDAATPGPWCLRGATSYDGPRYSVRSGYADSAYPITGTIVSDRERADARLIAAAPTLATLAADALDEVARLRAALDAIRRAHSPLGACLPGCPSWLEDYRVNDCTCGYCDAASDVAEYAEATLAAGGDRE